MGVRRFRSVEEMPGPAPLARLDPENLRIVFGLISLTRALDPTVREPGVRKFKSWQEAASRREGAPPGPDAKRS